MRIASNFSGDFLNFRAYVLESRMPWKEAVFETRLETTGNGTITIVRGERTVEQSKITAPVYVDRVPSSFPMRFHAFGWRGSQQWDNAQRVLLFETNVSGRWNEAKTFESARIENRWKIVCPSSMRQKGGGGLDETEKKFRPRSINRFKISNYRGGTFIIDLLKHLLLEQFYYPTILLSDYILLFEKYFSVRSVFTYIYIYIYRYTRIEFISSG